MKKLLEIIVMLLMFPIVFLFYLNKKLILFVISYANTLVKIAKGTV